VTADEMKGMDREAIEGRDIPGIRLMEAAGQGVAEAVLREFQDLEDARVTVLAGRGNNGGDGFVTARLLKRAELRPEVILVGAVPDELEGDASLAYAAWKEEGGETVPVLDEASLETAWGLVADSELVVDALLGTGTRGAPRGLLGKAVEWLEDVTVPIVAIDIPTGVDADTGDVPGVCVHADLTVTMALPKRGHLLYPGRSFTGSLDWVDIGIPNDILEGGEGPGVYVLETEDALEFLPDRDPEMHKGDRGQLLLVGGSAGLTGAVALAAEAAVRAGAGKVTAGIPRSLNDILEVKLTEPMTLLLPELEVRALSRDAFDTIALFQPGRLTALAIGPGLGRHPSTMTLVRRLLTEMRLPTVLDADGLHAYAGRVDDLRLRRDGPLVLTPHAGEFAALTGESPEAIHDRRFELCASWAQRLGVVLVLKGAPTVVGDPETGTVYVNPTGSEALATGGTGDVLTGLIAGFLAQGVDALEAALSAVFLHGWTADWLVEEWGTLHGIKAGDLVEAFPLALGDLLHPWEEEP